MQYVDEYLYTAIRASRGEFTELQCVCSHPDASNLLNQLVIIVSDSSDEEIDVAIDLACRCGNC